MERLGENGGDRVLESLLLLVREGQVVGSAQTRNSRGHAGVASSSMAAAIAPSDKRGNT
jgi:hypothetical protein